MTKPTTLMPKSRRRRRLRTSLRTQSFLNACLTPCNIVTIIVDEWNRAIDSMLIESITCIIKVTIGDVIEIGCMLAMERIGAQVFSVIANAIFDFVDHSCLDTFCVCKVDSNYLNSTN